MTDIRTVEQDPNTDELIILYQLDTSILGGPIFYFTANTDASVNPTTTIAYGGNTYAAIDMESSGWEWNAKGPLPTPKLRLSNTTTLIQTLMLSYNDLLGCLVTRLRTWHQFLDGQPGADGNAHMPLDIFRVERLASANKVFIEFELAAAIDQTDRQLPGRVVVQGSCDLQYRVWNGSSFDYTRATCPYTGTTYFDTDGNLTTISNDQCGKGLDDCVKRFTTAPLPFGGFPGVSKVRV